MMVKLLSLMAMLMLMASSAYAQREPVERVPQKERVDAQREDREIIQRAERNLEKEDRFVEKIEAVVDVLTEPTNNTERAVERMVDAYEKEVLKDHYRDVAAQRLAREIIKESKKQPDE